MERDAHQPVMCQAAIAALAIKANGCYIDATFGRGGHSRMILLALNQQGRLLILDKDLAAITYAKAQFDNARVHIYHQCFSQLKQVVTQQKLFGKINGILMDLGVSSAQLDDAQRGFSFLRDGPLDMRMDQQQALTATDYLRLVTERQLADILYQFGQERYSRRLAKAIKHAQQHQAITHTKQLADIVVNTLAGKTKNKHPATRTFQALRIVINDELDALQAALDASIDCLAPGGRLAVISFHSLEDRIVKQFINTHSQAHSNALTSPRLIKIGRYLPDARELADNRRARSATLRVAEKIAI